MLNTPTPPPSVEIDGASFNAALAATVPQATGMQPVQAPAVVEAPPVTPSVEVKPVEVKPADEKPKKGLDALPEEKIEEEKKEEKIEAKSPEEPEVDTSKWAKPQQQAFAAMRAEKKRAEEKARDAQIRYDKLQKEYEQAKANPKDSEETLKKLERLESWEKAQDLRSTPEWIETIQAPIQKSLDMLHRIADHANIDAQALIEATDEEVPFERILAIRKVFDESDTPVPDTLITAAVQEAEKLHPLYQKGSDMERNAAETLTSLRHQTDQQKAEISKAEEAAYVKHHDHIYGQMAKKLPSLFSKPEIADEVKAARPATDPAERAFQAQAAALLPSIAQELFALREEVKKEKASKLALLGARPGVNPSPAPTSKPASDDDVELDEEGLTSALRQRR
jgi:hypothetical protein